MNKNFIKTFLIITLLLGSVITVIHLIVRNNQPALTTDSTFTSNPNQFQNISYNGESVNFPNSLPLALAEPDFDSETIIKANLINNLNLSLLEKTDNVYINDDISINLTYTPQENYYSIFKQNEAPQEEDQGSWNTDQIINQATSQLKAIVGDINITTNSNLISYYKSFPGTELIPAAIQDANAVSVSFFYQLNNLPIYYQKTFGATFEIYLNNQYQLYQAYYYPQFIKLTPQEEFPLITINQAVKQINNGSVSLIDSNISILDPNTKFTSGSMSNVTLEYRIDNTSNIVYPFYHFSGTLTEEGGRKISADLITPAIKTEVEALN